MPNCLRFSAIFILFISQFSFAQSGRIPVQADSGMVVSSHYLASEAGRDILQKGGSAVDASIATAFALAVTLPAAGNLGGGGFLVHYGNDGKSTTFNFREKAPLAATREMYLDENGEVLNNSNHDSLIAVGVPGTVAGLYLAHQKYGKLPWSQLLEPAIKIAENGFAISPEIEWFSKWVLENKAQYKSTAKVFLKNNETALKPGDILIQKDLAETLKRIKDKGKDGFYTGKTASLVSDYMINNGGIITEEDLAKYEAEEREPIRGTYRDFEIIGMPPPSSGGVAVVEMLNILEPYDLAEMGQNSAQSLHYLTEAMRRAFADRAQYIGDPNFNANMPINEIISKDHAKMLQEQIEDNRASVSDSANFNKAQMAYESPETTHLSVIDKEGNAVSLTYTLEASYGSKFVVEGAGFLLNNEMGDFNAIPGLTNSEGRIGTEANTIEPEKRMLSSMTPMIVAKEGKPFLIIGSPGGRTIINTTLQVIVNVIDYELDIAKAIESPRIHHQWLPDVTSFEVWGFSEDTKNIYREMGHDIRLNNSQGRAMGIQIDPVTGMIYGAADSRSHDGRAVGY